MKIPIIGATSDELVNFILYLIALIFTTVIVKQLFTPFASAKKLPPSPSKLPIIGHLHKLGKLPHRSLQKLSLKHGPLMLLHLGSVPALVVSSAKAAEEIMKTHDLKFADRIKSKANEKLLYNYKDMSVSPYGEYWRQIRSICVVQLLSNTKVNEISKIREEETTILLNKIAESSNSSAIDLSELFMTLTNNVVSMAAFGRRYGEGESGRKFRKLMKEFMELLGTFEVGTYIPTLAWIDHLSGLNAKLDKVAKQTDEFFEQIVKERLNSEKKEGNDREKVEGREDFVDVLLGIYKNKTISSFSIDRDSIKAMILVSPLYSLSKILQLFPIFFYSAMHQFFYILVHIAGYDGWWNRHYLHTFRMDNDRAVKAPYSHEEFAK